MAAARHIYKNFYKIGARGVPEEIAKVEYQTVAISPIASQVNRTQQYIEQILASTFSWVDPITHEKRTNRCKIGWFFSSSAKGANGWFAKFLNGTRIDFFSIGDDKGSKMQGNDWYHMSYDEWTRSHHLREEIEANLLPRLALYGGTMDLLGTPDMESPSIQYVYEIINEAQISETYYFQGGSMTENIFFPSENRERLIASIRDKTALQQIVEGKIIFTGGRTFTADEINRIWVDYEEWKHEEEMQNELEPYLQDIPLHQRALSLTGYIWRLPPMSDGYKEGKYLIALDWHLSEGGDETVIYVVRYDVEPHEIYYYLATKRGDPYLKHMKIRNLYKIFNNASLVIDSQGVGKQLMYDLDDLQPTCFDSVSIGKEKRTMLNILKNYLAFRKDGVVIGKFRAPYTQKLSDQLSVYKEDDKRIKQDHVMALGIAAWWIQNQGEIVEIPNDLRF